MEVGRSVPVRQVLRQSDLAVTANAMEGDREAALRWLRRAIELGNQNKRWFQRDPNWESLREDPEYQQILDSISTPATNADEA